MNLWDFHETANYLRRSEGSLRKLVLRKKIPFRKVAGRVVFIQSEIINWVQESPGVKIEDAKNGE